jgi:hypothetical protein
MTRRSKIFSTLVAAGIAATAGPALAAQVIETTTYYVVPDGAAGDTRAYYYVTQGPQYIYTTPAPTTEVIYEEPPITVEAPRLTEDQRITGDVVDTLANDPWLSGRIGVETRDRDVNLTGTVTTPGQIRRAVRGARSVPGVDHVTSELRPRVGANTSY